MNTTDEILADINAATRNVMDDEWLADRLKNAPTWRDLIDEGLCTEDEVRGRFPDAVTGKIIPGRVEP